MNALIKLKLTQYSPLLCFNFQPWTYFSQPWNFLSVVWDLILNNLWTKKLLYIYYVSWSIFKAVELSYMPFPWVNAIFYDSSKVVHHLNDIVYCSRKKNGLKLLGRVLSFSAQHFVPFYYSIGFACYALAHVHVQL